MTEVIEHEGVKYRKVWRSAVEGDLIRMEVNDYMSDYVVGDVFTVRGRNFIDKAGDYRGIDAHKHTVLEPLPTTANPYAMPKLTDAKPGDTVRIVAVKDLDEGGYKIGDTFEVKFVWDERNGVDAKDSNGEYYELYAEEFEVVRDEVTPVDLCSELATSLTQAIDNVKKPAHYTQGGIEVIEYIEQVTAGYSDGFVAHCAGVVIKYVSRAPHKHAEPTEDLRKAREYLNFAIARLEASE